MPHDCDGIHCRDASHSSYVPSRTPLPPAPPHGPGICDGIHCHDYSHSWYAADRKAAASAAKQRQVAARAAAKLREAAEAEAKQQARPAAEAKRREAAEAEAKRQEAAAAEAKRKAAAAAAAEKAQPDRKSSLEEKHQTIDSRRSSVSSISSLSIASRRSSNISMRSASTAASSVSSSDGWQLKTLNRTPSNNFRVELEKSTLAQKTTRLSQANLRALVNQDISPTASNTGSDAGWKIMAFERTPSDKFEVKLEKHVLKEKKAKINQQKLSRLLGAGGKVTKSAEMPLKKR